MKPSSRQEPEAGGRNLFGLSHEEVRAADKEILDTIQKRLKPGIDAALNEL